MGTPRDDEAPPPSVRHKTTHRTEKNADGYKVFNPDWTSNHGDLVFEIGRTYRTAGLPRLCSVGLHFCASLADCFDYYDFDRLNHVCALTATGDIDSDGKKSCTNELTLVRELSLSEVMALANAGEDNMGLENAGDQNNGNNNEGSENVGDGNAGDRNVGDGNHGSRNAGNENSGSRNAGSYNAGSRNGGHFNAGSFNVGGRNAGGWNAGDGNAGSLNAGSRNAGSGNSGSRNAGSHNADDGNVGDWDVGSGAVGCFRTERAGGIAMFDRPSDWSMEDWMSSDARVVLEGMPGLAEGPTRTEGVGTDRSPVDGTCGDPITVMSSLLGASPSFRH